MPKPSRGSSRGGGGRGRGGARGQGRRGRGRGGSSSRPSSFSGEPGRKFDEREGFGSRRDATVRGGRGTRKSRYVYWYS